MTNNTKTTDNVTLFEKMIKKYKESFNEEIYICFDQSFPYEDISNSIFKSILDNNEILNTIVATTNLEAFCEKLCNLQRKKGLYIYINEDTNEEDFYYIVTKGKRIGFTYAQISYIHNNKWVKTVTDEIIKKMIKPFNNDDVKPLNILVAGDIDIKRIKKIGNLFNIKINSTKKTSTDNIEEFKKKHAIKRYKYDLTIFTDDNKMYVIDSNGNLYNGEVLINTFFKYNSNNTDETKWIKENSFKYLESFIFIICAIMKKTNKSLSELVLNLAINPQIRRKIELDDLYNEIKSNYNLKKIIKRNNQGLDELNIDKIDNKFDDNTKSLILTAFIKKTNKKDINEIIKCIDDIESWIIEHIEEQIKTDICSYPKQKIYE